MMKVVRLTGLEVNKLRLSEMAKTIPKEREVLVNIKAVPLKLYGPEVELV